MPAERILRDVSTVPDFDDRLREAAFGYLSAVLDRTGGVVSRGDIASFAFEGRAVRLIPIQRGIWRPGYLDAALSFVTVFRSRPDERPYDDREGPDGYLRYKWQGTDANAWDNVALRNAMASRKPLIWFFGVAPSLYQPIKVWLVGEEPALQQFVVALDETTRDGWTPALATAPGYDPVRRYAEYIAHARLHQPVFRARVLLAYGSQCALCRLRHPELLDAAHIREDADGGQPVIPNGLAMCAIHHRAFDAHVLGVRPDYRVEIRSDVLREHDGPTLRHALQGLHGEVILLPTRRAERPSRDLLEERFERFRAAV
jgi:putative restriction endonuclease